MAQVPSVASYINLNILLLFCLYSRLLRSNCLLTVVGLKLIAQKLEVVEVEGTTSFVTYLFYLFWPLFLFGFFIGYNLKFPLNYFSIFFARVKTIHLPSTMPSPMKK